LLALLSSRGHHFNTTWTRERTHRRPGSIRFETPRLQVIGLLAYKRTVFFFNKGVEIFFKGCLHAASAVRIEPQRYPHTHEKGAKNSSGGRLCWMRENAMIVPVPAPRTVV
jgi:hypothetical protein